MADGGFDTDRSLCPRKCRDNIFPREKNLRCPAQRAGAWKSQLLPSGRPSVEPVIHRARRHAVMAARRCRAEGVQVSVIIPNDAANGEFARAVAAAGRGLVRALGPESPERPAPAEHEDVADTSAPSQWSGTAWQELWRGGKPAG